MALGTVKITVNVVSQSDLIDVGFVKTILEAAQWDISRVSLENDYTGYSAKLIILATMHTSLDASQIIAWIRQDLGSRYQIGSVDVTVLTRTGKQAPKTTTPKTTTTPVTTPTNNGELAAINTRLNDLIASLNGNKAGTPTKKKTIDDYAAEFGVSKTALTLLVAAVGITVLISLTSKK